MNNKINLQKELDVVIESLDLMKLSNGRYVEDIKIYDDLIKQNKTIYSYPIIPLTYNLTMLKLINLLPENKQPTNKEFANYLNSNENSIGLFQFDKLNKFIETEGVNNTTFITLLYILLLLFVSPPASLESTFQSKYTYPLLITALTSLDIIPLL